MIKFFIEDKGSRVESTCQMLGTGLDLKHEIALAPAALIEQFIRCLQQNDVPAEVIRRQVMQVSEIMADIMKDRMHEMITKGEL